MDLKLDLSHRSRSFTNSTPSESALTISFPVYRSCNLCFITCTPLFPPPSSPFLFLSMSPCYVPPLCPNLWPLGFEERQRCPLKMATAKFVRGHSHECTSLSASLSRLHILPPLHSSSSLCPPQTHTNTLKPSLGPPLHK